MPVNCQDSLGFNVLKMQFKIVKTVQTNSNKLKQSKSSNHFSNGLNLIDSILELDAVHVLDNDTSAIDWLGQQQQQQQQQEEGEKQRKATVTAELSR